MSTRQPSFGGGAGGSLDAAHAERRPALLDARPGLAATPFHMLPATSGIKVQGADEIRETYAPYESSTMRAGARVPILYLRTTKGRSADWVFDPDWDIDRRCGEQRIADDSLASVIAYAEANRLPVLFTLNGGIWADASCDVPDWDINDELERDPRNNQWTARGTVPVDRALSDLAGSQASPEIGRALTLNVYAQKVRANKRRNLQAAARIVRDFAQRYPELFVGVSLDPDVCGRLPRFPRDHECRRHSRVADGVERLEWNLRRPARLPGVPVMAEHAGGGRRARSPGRTRVSAGAGEAADVRLAAPRGHGRLDGGARRRARAGQGSRSHRGRRAGDHPPVTGVPVRSFDSTEQVAGEPCRRSVADRHETHRGERRAADRSRRRLPARRRAVAPQRGS